MEYTKHPEGVFIPFKGSVSHKGQQMYIWPGLILQSNITEQKAQYNIKNGLFYKIIKVSETVTFKKIDTHEEETGDEMFIDIEEIPSMLLLSYAYTYHKSQARTIHGTIRLAQTSHKRFSQRHLIVGLGRAPNGKDIQVEGTN
jgi:ATP-dependent exoDNAse (exonuclease V) alpha subunit